MKHKLKRKELLGYGTMPTGPFNTQHSMIRAFTWFNVTYELSDLLPYIFEYMESRGYNTKDINKARRNDDHFSIPNCVVAYYLVNNIDVYPKSEEYLNTKIKQAIEMKIVNTKPSSIVFNKPDPKYTKIIETIEQHIDNVFKTSVKLLPQFKFVTARSMFPELKGLYTIADLKSVVSYYTPLLHEYNCVIKNTDPELSESYRNVSKEHLKYLHTFLTDLINYFNENAVITRKRKKKTKTKAVKVASKMAFNFNIRGVKVESSPQVVNTLPSTANKTIIATYNDKYNRMNVYIADQNRSLENQNGKVLNYDEKKSHSKFVRISEASIKEMTKEQFTAWFFSLKSAEIPIPKKITDQVRILKVW